MNVPWTPVIAVDIIGSLFTLIIAIICTRFSWHWYKLRQDDIFRSYIFLLTLAFVFFAVSRSFGHLVKQCLIFYDLNSVWAQISPFSGAINTASFIVIFAFGVYFQRFQNVHQELEDYKDNLEHLVAQRTVELEQENRQRQNAEEELRQANVTLENIFDSTSPVCITNTNFVLVKVNEAYKKLWTGPDAIGSPIKCYESRPGQLCHTENCPLEQILQGKKECFCETQRMATDGTDRVFLQTTKPFRDADGNLIGTVTSFHEITERKRALDDLAAERERLAVTLRSIGDGVITTDIQGRIVMINKVAEQLCGWKQSEARGKGLTSVFSIINDKTGQPVENPVDKVLASGNIIALEGNTVLVARDGTRRNIADSGAPIRDTQSRIVGVVLVFRDVTDKLHMEKDLIRTQKLESVGILAGGIAHDFNNILAAILGNINLAIHKLGDEEKVSQLLHDAEKASLRAKDLTLQLLTFAKGGSPVRRTVSIAGIIKDSAVFILRGSNVGCEMDIPEGLWLVDIDPGQMSQVVQNIILNAREAMPDGGTVKISVSNREGSLPDSDISPRQWVEITITDNGPGIGQDVVDRLFDPYFTTKDRGSGLGLSICHSIVTQHMGIIKATSAPGEGASFVISLPASTGQKGFEEQPEVEMESRQKGCKVLVMDDEEMVRKIAGEMLQHLGHQIAFARDGQEAVDAYRKSREEEQPFDIVIMDLTIPGGMGGKEAVQKILTLDPGARVIVSSGYSNDPVMASFEQYGFCAAVIKPFQLKELDYAVNTALAYVK